MRRALALLVGLLAVFAMAYVVSGWRRAWHYVAPARAPEYDQRPDSKPLVEAARAGDFARAKSLLDKGISPDAVVHQEDTEGRSALQAAAGEGHLDVVKLLLDRGADVNAPDFWGGTAIIDASVGGWPDVVDLLIHRGADVNANDDGATALGYAKYQIVEKHGADELERYRRVVNLLENAGAREWPFGW